MSWKRTRQGIRVGDGLTPALLITLLKYNNGVCKSLITSSSIYIKSLSAKWLNFLASKQVPDFIHASENLHVHHPRKPHMHLRTEPLRHQASPQGDDAWTSTTGSCRTIISLATITVAAIVVRLQQIWGLRPSVMISVELRPSVAVDWQKNGFFFLTTLLAILPLSTYHSTSNIITLPVFMWWGPCSSHQRNGPALTDLSQGGNHGDK